MSKSDFNPILLVGLGNVGKEYEATRHNFGFLFLDQLIDDYGFFSQGKRMHSEIFSGEIDGKRVILIKPQTFMNRSGIAVSEVASFFKIKPADILVFYDDVDLELGRVRIKSGGGSAGHNGIKSLDSAVGKGYHKFRLGIGKGVVNTINQEENFLIRKIPASDYVLAKFSLAEMEIVKGVNQKLSQLLPEILNKDFDRILNKFYQKFSNNGR